MWTSGKTHLVADALSRSPAFSPGEEDVEHVHVFHTVSEDPQLEQLVQEARDDKEYQEVISTVLADVPHGELPLDHPAREYGTVRNKLSVEQDLLIMNGKIVVPFKARERILQALHVPHNGIVKTRVAARQLYYWPKMNHQIQQLIDSCEACQRFRASQQHEPLMMTESDHAFDAVGADLFHHKGNNYLVLVDRFSGFPIVSELKNTSTASVISKMHNWFLLYGFPRIIRTDGGPQFRSDFKGFCKEHGIKHEVSSPHHPRSNGLAESAVKNVKSLLKKCDNFKDFEKRLAAWRNSPRHDGFSPSEMMFGRRLRGNLPALPEMFLPIDIQEASDARKKQIELIKSKADHRLSELPKLKVGQHVSVQDPISKKWDSRGVVWLWSFLLS